jgi:cysteinyl-tRNA synthetase
MSKSIGNVFLISEALKVVAPNVLRFFFVETLYSSPLEYNLDQLHQASRAFERIVITMQRLEEAIHRAKTGPIDEKILRGFERLHDSFHQALAQNFNTPQGIAVIMNAVRELNKLLDTTSLALEDLKTIQHYFEDWFETLGLVDVATTELSKDEWDLMAELKALASHHHIEFSDSTTLPEMIHAFIQKREQFRQNKQYFESDTIRNDLYALKIQLEDKKEGTEYRTIP